jgi:phospholipase C
MGYWDRSMLPASYALADEYALCQRWFAPVLSSTWPNRFYSLMASSFGKKSNEPPRFDGAPSIFDRLTEAGIRYGGYFGNVPFLTIVPGARVNGAFEQMDYFWGDAERGLLPPVTIIDPIFGQNDDHPPAHPLGGQVLISSIYQALANSPQWDRMLFIITYDEHGGFFDHVPPPTTEDPYPDFRQMGFRVPSIVIGPYVKQMVSDTVFDHTSFLAFLERRFDLEPLNERDAAANDLTDLLDWDRIAALDPKPPIQLATIEADDEVLNHPDCRYLTGGRSARGIGQPELEAFLDGLPERLDCDQRHLTAEHYANFLAQAEAMGVLRRS